MYKLVIFDFDDTLVHLDVDWQDVKSEVLSLARSEGISVDVAQHLVPMGNALSERPALKEAIDSIYLRHEMLCAEGRGYVPFRDMLALAKELRAKGRKIAIASGNHTLSIRRILADLGLLQDFDLVCGRDAVPRNKPAPDQLLLIMRKLAARKQDALFAGDSPFDRLSAKAAGIDYVSLRPNSGADLAKLRRILLSA
jgi:phosphoglycolate phosphatase